MKIVSTGRTISTTEYVEKKQRARRQRLFIIIGILFALLVAVVFVLRMKSLRITTVDVFGATVTGAEPVEAATRHLLTGNYVWIVPRANALIYPESRIEQGLLKDFPRFSSVSAALVGRQGLRIDAVERTPAALYCTDAASSSPCYFMDTTGFVFAPAPTFTPGVWLEYSSNASLANPLGTQFIPAGEFESLSAFMRRLKEEKVEPISATLTGHDWTILLSNGAKVFLARQADASKLGNDLASFLTSDAIKNEPNFWQKLDTLDLRTANKIFYTFTQ